MITVFEPDVLEVHARMYQSWVVRDSNLFKGEPQPVLSNWHPEDLAAYCGGEYTERKNA